jgi:hypothetical protein
MPLPIPTARRFAATAARITLTLAAAAAICPPTSGAGVYTNNGRDWYFYGATYHNHFGDSTRRRSDPVSFVMYGGRQGGNPACTGNDFEPEINYLCQYNTWTSAWPAMHKSICSRDPLSDAFMRFRDMHGKRDFVEAQVQFYTARPHTVDRCPAGYHVRWWSDEKHSEQTGHKKFSWWAGAIHHEHRSDGDHVLDMPWDDVRVNAWKQYRKSYCAYRHYKVHPGAVGKFGKYENSGMISRFSINRKSDVPSCP